MATPVTRRRWRWFAALPLALFGALWGLVLWTIGAALLIAALLLSAIIAGPQGPGPRSMDELRESLGQAWWFFFTWGVPYACAIGAAVCCAIPFLASGLASAWRGYWKTRTIIQHDPTLRHALRMPWRWRGLLLLDCVSCLAQLCLGLAMLAFHDFVLELNERPGGFFNGPEGPFLHWLAYGSLVVGVCGLIANATLLVHRRRAPIWGAIAVAAVVVELGLFPYGAATGPNVGISAAAIAVVACWRGIWLILYSIALVRIAPFERTRRDALRRLATHSAK